MCLFGDGAANRGDFHEGINLAAALKLPVVFVLMNNMRAISITTGRSTGGLKELAVRAKAYGIPGVTVDGNDVRKVYTEAMIAINRARAGEGPTLLECMLQRWTGHSMMDPDTYRNDEERELAKKNDPVARFKRELMEEGVLTQHEIEKIEAQVKKEIDEAIHYAENECTLPTDPSDILRSVYASH